MRALARLGQIAILGTAVVAAGGVRAQDRMAIVVANAGYDGELALPGVRDVALDMSEALFGLGFTVQRLENPDLAAITEAITEIQTSGGPVVIYYAGHGFAFGGESYLQPVGASGDDLAALAAQSLPLSTLFAARENSQTFVFLDTCHAAASQAMPGAGALDVSMAERAAARPDLMVISAVQPGVACPVESDAVVPLTPFLIERLGLPGLPSTEILPDVAALPPTPDSEATLDGPDPAPPAPGLWAESTLAEPFVFRSASSDVRLSADDYAVLDSLSPAAQQQMIAMWRQAGIAVDIAGADAVAPVSPTVDLIANDGVVLIAPVETATAVQPMAVASVGTVDDGVSIFNANPAPAPVAALRPVPGAGGLPTPSIIVGFPERVVEANFETAPTDLGPVSGSELSFDDLEARRALRTQDAELFASLVESGAFDPPVAQIAVALQTELQRMGCYTGRIDGDWGRGSRAAATRYYDQIGGTLPSQDADVSIFRQIVLRDDVECPAPPPVAAAPARQQAAPRQQNTRTQAAPRQQQAAPRAAPAPAPAPAAPGRRTLAPSSGTGVYR